MQYLVFLIDTSDWGGGFKSLLADAIDAAALKYELFPEEKPNAWRNKGAEYITGYFDIREADGQAYVLMQSTGDPKENAHVERAFQIIGLNAPTPIELNEVQGEDLFYAGYTREEAYFDELNEILHP